jgi:hypothetical protein
VVAVLLDTEGSTLRPIPLELVECFGVEMDVEVGVVRVEGATHDSTLASRVVAPQTALILREVAGQDAAELFELWVYCWVAAEHTDYTPIAFETLAGLVELLWCDHHWLAG